MSVWRRNCFWMTNCTHHSFQFLTHYHVDYLKDTTVLCGRGCCFSFVNPWSKFQVLHDTRSLLKRFQRFFLSSEDIFGLCHCNLLTAWGLGINDKNKVEIQSWKIRIALVYIDNHCMCIASGFMNRLFRSVKLSIDKERFMTSVTHCKPCRVWYMYFLTKKKQKVIHQLMVSKFIVTKVIIVRYMPLLYFLFCMYFNEPSW